MRKKVFIPLRELRKNSGVTLDEVAIRLGVTKQAISRWELGRSYPELDQLPKLAEMFNVSTDFLLSYKPPNLEIENDDDELLKKKYFWKPTINLILISVLKYLPPTKPLKVLEIGCDDGYCALALARLGYLVTALECSAIKLEKIKQLAKIIRVSVDLIPENILDYEFDDTYDLIYSLNMSEKLAKRDRARIFEKIKSQTKVGGLNIFETTAYKNFEQYETAEDDYAWKSGELFGIYYDWRYEVMDEKTLDGDKTNRRYKNFIVSRKI